MSNPWLVALSALFLWWFSTGVIIWRVKRADHAGPGAHLRSVLYGLPLLIGGFAALIWTRDMATDGGVYVAFLSAMAIWGWVELAFLSGVITGPNTAPCPAGVSQTERFWRAVGTIAWHEIALILMLGLMAHLSTGAANQFGLWTFVVLFFARISAKLNLFFGVPRIHTEFLPNPLSHLASHFRHAPMNWVFPVSITALSFASACWMERAYAATDEAFFVGHVLLTTLTLLALLEHWFMVLPLPDQKLWRWMLPKTKATPGLGSHQRTGAMTAETTLTVRK